MTQSKTYLRGLFIIILLAGLVAVIVMPTFASVRALPQQVVAPGCGLTLAQWTFDNLSAGANSSPNYSSLASDVSSALLTVGSGVSSPTITTSSSLSSPNNWYASSFTTAATLDITTNNDYFQFAIDTTQYANVNLNFYAFRSPQGPQSMQVYYSSDGTNFTALTGTYAIDVAYPANAFVADLTNLTNPSGTTYIRIYGWNAGGGGGTVHLDDITFTGCHVVTIDSITPNPTNNGTTVTWHALKNGTYEIRVGGTDCNTSTVTTGNSGSYSNNPNPFTSTINASDLTPDGQYKIYVCVTASGITNFAVSSIVKDTTPPSVTVNLASGQASSTAAFPINFSVVFSEPIDTSTFTTADITQNGTVSPTGITWSITNPSSDKTNFILSATAVTGNGTLIPTIAAGVVTDLAGNSNVASTSTNNTVTFTGCTTYSHHSLLINEVAWMGTKASSADEWVELYNPGTCAIDLTGWKLIGNNYYYSTGVFTVTIPAQTPSLSIAPGGYFIVAAKNQVFQSTLANFYSTEGLSAANSLNLADHYQSLQLVSPTNIQVDTANSLGSYTWPAGSATTDTTMERYGSAEDSPAAWVTYAGPSGPTSTNVKDRNGNYVLGTPGGPNWAYYVVTITPSPIPTATPKPKVPTPIPPTPFAHVVINEYLPRAGFDWNNDGVIDVNDEFIEIKNNGPIDVSLSGWKLSDDPNIGNRSFTLPSQTLKAGQRAVFYGSTTHILLVDSGDTIRLSNSRGVIVDAQSYGVVKAPDQSRCRYPDGSGYWQQACFPTPGNENVLTGTIPSAPPAVIVNQPAPCLLPDTTPLEFRLAICSPFGADIWSRKFWDNSGNKFIIPDPFSKGEVVFQ